MRLGVPHHRAHPWEGRRGLGATGDTAVANDASLTHSGLAERPVQREYFRRRIGEAVNSVALQEGKNTAALLLGSAGFQNLLLKLLHGLAEGRKD